MTTFNSFFRLLSFVVLCFATTLASAQVAANGNFYDTGNPYTNAATDGMGSRAVVALVKPASNQIRVSTYSVAETGAVTWKANYDFSSASIVKVAMLSETRVVVASAGPSAHKVTIFDIDPTTGALTKKGEWTGFAPAMANLSITRLTNESFATSFRTDVALRIVSFSVPSNGNVIKQAHLDTYWCEGQVDMARLTDTRLVAAIQTTTTHVKFVCFDVAPLTLAITKKGELGWGNTVSKLSLATFSYERFSVFAIDANSRLDAMTLTVSTAGNITLADAKLDIKKPGTSDYLELKDIDAQTISTSPGKMLLSAIRTNDKLTVVPFSLANGAIAVQTGGYYPNAPLVTQASAGFVVGNRMISSFRLQDTGKYRIQTYKWN